MAKLIDASGKDADWWVCECYTRKIDDTRDNTLFTAMPSKQLAHRGAEILRMQGFDVRLIRRANPFKPQDRLAVQAAKQEIIGLQIAQTQDVLLGKK